MTEEPRLFAWRPLDYSSFVYVLARPTGAVAPAVAELRAAVTSLDPHVPLIGIRTLESAMGAAFFLQRAAAVLIGAFAAIALLLAATGIFGLLAYTVEQRRREIGIRIAMGASGAGVVRSVVGMGMRPVAIGVVLGLAGALAATRVLEGLLYDVPPRDPITFAAAAAVLFAAAAVAAWLPARRATRVDPAGALNAE